MKVVLGGIVKNIEKYFLNAINFIVSLKLEIPNLEVCIYENNSTDSTKIFLDNFVKHNSYVQYLSEDLEDSYFLKIGNAFTWDKKPCRIEMIAYARNKLLQMIVDKNLSSSDYVIIVDLDFSVAPDVSILSKTLKYLHKDVHALFANGIQRDQRYYDAYELRTEEFPWGPEIIGDVFWSTEHMQKLQPLLDPSGPPIPVYSAFGGLAIYRADVIKDCTYSADITDALHNFYKGRIFKEEVITHHKGALLGCYLKDSSIFYKNNSGYNYPIAAEHVNFNYEIRSKGYKNMFIAPFLYYYWG